MDEKKLQVFLKEIEKKNSWGKNEIKELVLKIMIGEIK